MWNQSVKSIFEQSHALAQCYTSLPPTNEVTRRQCFVCLSVCSGRGGGGHVIITHDALDRTIQGSSLALVPPLKTWDMETPSWPPSAGGHYWRPVQTCSLDLTVQTLPLVLTSDGHKSTYSRQTGGMHLTGLYSCFS